MINHYIFLSNLLPRVGKLIMKYFRQDFTAIERINKEDGSPVTIADQQAELLIRQNLQKFFPQDTIWGEEQENIEGVSNGLWIIDPIDGTENFISHNPMFGTLIGYHNGMSMMTGSVYLPALDELWFAETGGTTLCNNIVVHTSKVTTLIQSKLSTTSIEFFDKQGKKRWKSLAQATRQLQFGGNCNQYLQLASGGIDLVFEENLKPYDILPLIPIVQSAGGVITDRFGYPLKLESSDSCLAAANPALHKIALERLE